MRRRRKLWILAALVLSMALVPFVPVTERLPHPEIVKVDVENGLDLPLKLQLVWYDLGLNTNRFCQMIEFDVVGRARVPAVGVRTRLWRLGLKRVLSPFD